MNRILLLIISAVAAFGQLTTPSTFLAAAVFGGTTSQWCVTDASAIVLPSVGVNGSLLLADQEVAQVIGAGSNSTCFKVRRGQMGTSATASHVLGAQVWIGQPATSSGDPSRPFNGAFVTSVPVGSCVIEDQYTLPVLYVGATANGAFPGSQYQCTNGTWVGSRNPWVLRDDGLFYSGFPGTTIIESYSDQVNTIARFGNGTEAAPAVPDSGNNLLALGADGWTEDGFTGVSGNITFTASEAWSTSAKGTEINFRTTPNGSTTRTLGATLGNDGRFSSLLSGTFSNCSSSASPAVCGSASAGSVTVAAAATTKVVNTTAVTADSQILLTFDASLGTKLGVTCNTTFIAPYVSARTAGTSFTITLGSGPVTNPECISYQIIN